MSAVVSKVGRPATLEDLLALPEEGRGYELIEGVLVEKAPLVETAGLGVKRATSAKHGRVQRKVSAYIDPFDHRPGGRWPGGWWFGTEIHVSFDATETLQPDVAGWRRERLAEPSDEAVVTVRPDWVCEILSTNRRNDLIKKKRVYHRNEVPHYWILDPEDEALFVYRWAPEGYVDVLTAERGERVHAEPFEAVELIVSELFGDGDEEAAT